MDRTESKVVQAAPSYENEMIQEMETFGWNLHGRQEMHEKGNAKERVEGSSYVVTTEVSKYVKLHFSRSLTLPSLARVRELEHEYFSQEIPSVPSQLTPGCLAAFGGACLFAGVVAIADSGSEGVPVLAVGLLMLVVGIGWIRSRKAQQVAARELRENAAERKAAIRQEVAALLSAS